MMNSKELLNHIINNLDNFENLSEIHNALNEAKVLAGESNETLNKIYYCLTMAKEFLENNIPKDLINIQQLLERCDKLIDELIIETKGYKEKIEKEYEYIIKLDNISYEDIKKIYKTMREFGKKIRNFLDYISKIFDDINDYIIQYSIDKKYKNKIIKLKNFRKEFDKYYKELKKLHNTVNSIIDAYGDIVSHLVQYISTSQVLEEDYVLPILTNLKLGLYDGLYSIDILNYMTGLYNISANPVTELIFLKLGNGNTKTYSLEELFYRYPPFEPISIKDENNEVIGNKIWFIKPKNGKFGKKSFKNSKLSEMEVIKGEIKKEYMTNKLKSVELIDLLGDDINKYILITLKSGNTQFNRIRIKYGSGKLKELISQEKTLKEIEKIYKEHLLKYNRKKGYSPTNLSYIWFCMWGMGLSTDPWDIDCPFREYCWFGKEVKFNNKKCPLWSWSRRIYPKVFPVIKRKTPNKKLEFSESFNGIIPIYGRNVLIKDEYCGVQFNIPGGIYPVDIEFETPIGKELTKTNVVGLAIDKKFVKTIISSLLNEEISNYSVRLFDIEIPISDIILSKCFLIASTNKGLNTYQLLEKDFKNIVDKYKQFKSNFKKGSKINGIFSKEVIDDAVYILLHTLAHLLLGFLSKELEIKSEDLLYLVDDTNEYYRILIAENSPIGALDIIGATKNKFSSLTNMIIKFLESAHNLLKEHEKQLKSYEELISKHIDMFKKKDPQYIHNIKVIEELRKHYSEFLKNGLVLDLHYFNTYMQLKKGDRTGYGKYGDLINSIVKDKELSEKLKKEINNIFTLAFPTYCIDGCTSCTMFDKGCFDGLGQSITTSKELTKLFIEIILKRREFRGYGNTVLKNIIESLCKKELVVLSPYIDEEGINFLNELSKKGISVKLITNKKMIEDFNKLFSESEFEIYVMKSNHDKMYYIDNKILLKSTANLNLKSNSVNRFEIYPINNGNSYKMILKQAEKWKK